MPKIFISYRRADSQYVTDSIFEHMVQHFGSANVFLDVGSIPLGVDFRQHLREQIQAHDVVLVIIGPDWARIMRERSQETNDFVRLEIEIALQMGKLLIPVLVKNAPMPEFGRLPSSIQDLQWRQYSTVRRQPHFANDCLRIAKSIQEYFKSRTPTTAVRSQPQPAPAPASSPIPPREIVALVRDILPAPFDWVDIPGGRVRLELGGYVDEDDKRVFVIPMFSVAKYPVTNAQFAKFVNAHGYQRQEFWTRDGWQERQKHGWTEPRYWGSSKWNSALHPVVGISWYEALAYCRWLHYTILELANSGTPPPPPTDDEQLLVTLPTEQQWQRAAQAADGRKFPWGSQWSAQRANTKESAIQQTTPVTEYEGLGDSPYGVVDMAGNVFEWCLTDYASGSQGYVEKKDIVLRGGSWYVGYANANTYNRPNFYPNYRENFIGFRLATDEV